MGWAFGRPRSTSREPKPNKRRALDRSAMADGQSAPLESSKVTSIPNAVSAPAVKTLKRGSLRRPQSWSNILDDGRWTTNSTPAQRNEGGHGEGTSTSQGHEVPNEPEPFAFEFRGAATNTVKSSWLRRMSTLSIYNHDDSPTSSPRPDSASISFSNGSTAPILHSTASSSPAVPPRNKLVKRESSQRALHSLEPTNSSSLRTQIPTLRRPATSHQRSATIQQQQHLHDGRRKLQDLFQPPSEDVPKSLSEAEDQELASPETSNVPDQEWSPFFNVRKPGLSKEALQKRGTTGVYPRNNPLKVIIPAVDELPTLMAATSINPKASQDSRPCTPAVFDTIPPPTTASKQDASVDMEQKPTRSFSIGDIFSSPSPPTWKAGSLRRAKDAPRSTPGRRVVSAPLSGKHRHATTPPNPSSPLPHLNRLSVFEIDLPRAPSYPETQPAAPSSYPLSPEPDVPSSSPTGPQTDRSTSQRHSPANIGTFSSPPPPTLPRNKVHRPSMVPSDHASTLVGSDNENSRFLSGDEDDGDMDCQSETVFDSLRTGATGSSHSGIRGPRIETIFDESLLPGLNENKLAGLADLLSSGSFTEHNTRRAPIAEEEENLSTPIRASLERMDDDFATPVRRFGRMSQGISSSPPITPLQLKNRLDHEIEEIEDVHVDEDWSSDDARDDTWDRNNRHNLPVSDKSEKQMKSNIFDWSEHQVGSDELLTGSSPRPNTVHGRHHTEARGSRTSGRRAPSGLHLRSQSVPVPPDTSAHRSYNNASKLDAWIQGQKTVSEDWDGDFEFDEVEHPGTQDSARNAIMHTNRSANILVPNAILERQATFHGQYGQVKELTLLVEELERLRVRASPLGLIQGPSAELWKEAEGIISLATVNEDEQDFFPPRSPQSPALEFDPFEDDFPVSQGRRESGPAPPKDDQPNGHDDYISVPSLARSPPANSKISTPPTARPRKESSAKAKSVLEDILKQRSNNDPPLVDIKSPQKKLPFDTTSLRDLVTRAGVVTRALKEIVRRAENGPASPGRRPGTPPDPPFSQMFQNPPSSPFSSPQLPKSTSKGSFLGGSITGNDNDINGHMKMMTVV